MEKFLLKTLHPANACLLSKAVLLKDAYPGQAFQVFRPFGGRSSAILGPDEQELACA